MSTIIVAQSPSAVTPTQINDVEYAYQYVMGKELWRSGKPISACLNEAQADGWQQAEAKGYDAYLRGLLEEAEDGGHVDWDAAGIVYNQWGDGYW